MKLKSQLLYLNFAGTPSECLEEIYSAFPEDFPEVFMRRGMLQGGQHPQETGLYCAVDTTDDPDYWKFKAEVAFYPPAKQLYLPLLPLMLFKSKGWNVMMEPAGVVQGIPKEENLALALIKGEWFLADLANATISGQKPDPETFSPLGGVRLLTKIPVSNQVPVPTDYYALSKNFKS